MALFLKKILNGGISADLLLKIVHITCTLGFRCQLSMWVLKYFVSAIQNDFFVKG